MDDQQLHCPLTDDRDVRGVSAKESAAEPGAGGLAGDADEYREFGSGVAWGWAADRIGRHWAIMLPALIRLPLVPLHLLTHSYAMIVVFFGLQGWFAGGGIWS